MTQDMYSVTYDPGFLSFLAMKDTEIKLTLSMPQATIVMISHLVKKVPWQELLSVTEFSVRLV